jgi:GntR family transcriptional regulator, rspAB operon transcriptional repressor
LRELAYKNIQDMIATRQIKPGDYINERALSKELGIGRTPTRQALEQLTLNRLVQFIPGKGSIARPVGQQELLQITEVRVVNEALSARLAARHATDDDIQELDGILSRAEHWTSSRNVERLLLLDRSFHAYLAKMSQNELLQDILSLLHERSLGYWFVMLSAPNRLHEIAAEHAAIVDAIRLRDEDAAASAMGAHIKALFEAVAGTFSTGNSAQAPTLKIIKPDL